MRRFVVENSYGYNEAIDMNRVNGNHFVWKNRDCGEE